MSDDKKNIDEKIESSSSKSMNNNNDIFHLDNDNETPNKTTIIDKNGTTIDNNNDDDNKRKSQSSPTPTLSTSSTNIKTNTMPVFGITPPNFISFEEIMKTANEMNRIALVNEIVFNNDFKLQRNNDNDDDNNNDNENNDNNNENNNKKNIEKQIRKTMKKAFWDIFEEQLNEQPPNNQQSISLLNEIKETLLLFLMPQHQQLKNEINEILDLELIKQKIDNNAFDFNYYAKYILSVCSRLCCPARDEMIKNLLEINEIIPLFKGIFELLEVMRLDFANFYIEQFRPHIRLASVEYEREKFKNLIEAHQKYNIDVLEYTNKWLKKTYESLDLSQDMNNMQNLFNKILISSYLELLHCLNPSFNYYLINNNNNDKNNDNEKFDFDDYPETLLLMRNRIDIVREKIFKLTLISSIFVVTFASIGEPLQSIKDFRIKLKNELEILLSSSSMTTTQQSSSPLSMNEKLLLQYLNVQDLKSLLESISIQIQQSIKKAMNDYDIKIINDDKFEQIKLQILELSASTNRIRIVMERRILEFIERVLQSTISTTTSTSSASLLQQKIIQIQVPNGFSTFSTELINIGSEFTRLVSHNRAIYSPYYIKLLTNITGQENFLSQSELNGIEKSFYG